MRRVLLLLSALTAAMPANAQAVHPAGTFTVPPPSGPTTGHIPDPAHSRARFDLKGRVASFHRSSTHGIGWVAIEISGSGPAARRTIALTLDDPAVLPFKVGDHVSARMDCTNAGWGYPCRTAIHDARGQPLVLLRLEERDAKAEGWRIQLGPRVSRGRDETRYAVRLSHLGRSVVVQPHRWQRWTAPDGQWLLWGWAMKSTSREPDSVPAFLTYTIMRAPRPPRVLHPRPR